MRMFLIIFQNILNFLTSFIKIHIKKETYFLFLILKGDTR